MPLVDACVTEWRITLLSDAMVLIVPLVDACVTEWRKRGLHDIRLAECHSLMPVLLNGGRQQRDNKLLHIAVPLVDACVTEWRTEKGGTDPTAGTCHSLMPVLLNGGGRLRGDSHRCCATR